MEGSIMGVNGWMAGRVHPSSHPGTVVLITHSATDTRFREVCVDLLVHVSLAEKEEVVKGEIAYTQRRFAEYKKELAQLQARYSDVICSSTYPGNVPAR